jgi:YVTN family beta-propeller protein
VANQSSGTVTPITVATNTAGSPITVGATPIGIAVTPNGQTAYVTNYGSGTVTPITVATNTAGTAITAGTHPYAVAVTPDQGPVASFTVTPASPGLATSFDASASGVASGTITNYAWTFGDTTTANTSTPTTTHTYATGGSYTATLTVTDSAGTSTTQVFTGQTVSNNGGSSAQASQSFTLPPTVTAVSPNAGPVGGGTVVTITGTGFVPGSTTVQFGATAGTSVTCSSTTSCSATFPARTGTRFDSQCDRDRRRQTGSRVVVSTVEHLSVPERLLHGDGITEGGDLLY